MINHNVYGQGYSVLNWFHISVDTKPCIHGTVIDSDTQIQPQVSLVVIYPFCITLLSDFEHSHKHDK